MNPLIHSDQNATLKQVRKLQQKKHRDAAGKIIIEGRNLVLEAYQKGVVIDTLLISENFEAEDWLLELENRDSRVYRVEQRLFEKLTDARNGSGLLAVVDRPIFRIEDAMQPGGNVVVLDRLQDPGNIGTIIRTSVAAGYDAVIALKGTADIYSPKVLRATAGMVFDVPVILLDGVEDLKELLQQYHKRIAVTEPDGGVPYYELDLTHDIALVIGNEGNGISDELIARADARITIPMCGDIESLNAAISAAILMYERVRCQKPGN